MAGKEDQIKTQIVIEGEKEYRDACKGINTSLREIGSEMKVVTAEFGTNSKSIEGLTAKQDVLSKKLEEQKRAVSAAEDALRKMKEGGVEPTDAAYLKMQTRLNNATADMIKTEKEIEKTGQELEEAEKSANSFSGEVKNTAAETEKAGGKFEKVGQVLGTVGKAFGTALASLGTAAVGAATALAGLTVSASNYADDLITQATYTRQSTDELQKYAYAARFIDVEVNTLTKSMAKNIKSMDAARDGSAQYADAYQTLGVAVTDANGELRDSNEVYWECVDALSGIENETERDAIAMQVFGKSAQELNSVIEAGSDAFKDLGNEAEEMGFILSEDSVNALGAFNDKLQILGAGMDGLKNSASLIALPFLDTMASEGIPILTEFSKGISDANGDVTKMGDVLGKGISDVLNLVIEKLPEFIEMGVNMVQSLVEGLADNAPELANAAIRIVETLVNGIGDLLPVLIDGAVQIIVGLAQGLGESLPRLIPQVVQMVMTIIQTLIENIPLLMEAAFQLMNGLSKGLINAIPVMVQALPKIINSLIKALLGYIPMLIQSGIDLLTSLVEALPEIITAIVEAIPLIIDGIITAVLEAIPLIIQAGIDLLVALIQALPEIITTLVNAIPQIVSSLVDAIIGNIPMIIDAGVQLFVSLIENLPTIIVEIVKAVPQIIKGIVEGFGSLLYKIVEIGGNILKGIWDGISGAAGWLWDQITGFFNGIVDGIKNFFGIASPSKLFAEIGDFLMQGLGEGIEDGSEDATKAMDNAVGDINDSVSGLADPSIGFDSILTGFKGQSDFLAMFREFGEYMAEGLGAGLANEMQKVKNSVRKATDATMPSLQTPSGKIQKNDSSGVQVVQNIYANETNYVQQQREAAKNFRMIAREVMA